MRHTMDQSTSKYVCMAMLRKPVTDRHGTPGQRADLGRDSPRRLTYHQELLRNGALDQVARCERGLVDVPDERRRGGRGFDHVDEVQLITPPGGPEPPRAPDRG